MDQKIRMRCDIYRWVGFGDEKTPELSLKRGKEYQILRRRSPGVVTVVDEHNLVQLVIVPFEAIML
jgi:hypothetical protein